MSTINDIKGHVFGDVILPIKMTVAPSGKYRSEKGDQPLTVYVNLKGVTLESLVDKAASQLSVDYKRTRRLKKSNGVFETVEDWQDWYDKLEEEGDHKKDTHHFDNVAKAPSAPMSDEEASAKSEAAVDQMSVEAAEAHLAELQRKLEEKRKREAAQAQAEAEAAESEEEPEDAEG